MLPLHPAIVHLPLGLAVAIPMVLVVLTVALYRNRAPAGAFLGAGVLQAMVVAGGGLALFTGGQEEERMEGRIPEAVLEQHEHLATAFLLAATVTLVLTVSVALVHKWASWWTRRLAIASAIGSLGVLVLGVLVGHAGGNLVYRDGAADLYRTPAATPESRHQL